QWWGMVGQTALALGCVVASAMGQVEVGIPCVVGGALSGAAPKGMTPHGAGPLPAGARHLTSKGPPIPFQQQPGSALSPFAVAGFTRAISCANRAAQGVESRCEVSRSAAIIASNAIAGEPSIQCPLRLRARRPTPLFPIRATMFRTAPF